MRRGLAADPGGFALTARQAASAGAPSQQQVGEICFTGWLGLLRALYEATGARGVGQGPEP